MKLLPNQREVYNDEFYMVIETKDDMSDMSTYTIYDSLTEEYLNEFEFRPLGEDENFRDSEIFQEFLDVIEDMESLQNKWWDDDWGSQDYFKGSKSPSISYFGKQISKEEQDKMVEDLCKSDTIVFHQTDPTTVMLDPIYEGKGWDVYKENSWGSLDKDHIHELIKRHERVVCLGHGTSRGLLSGIIGESEVPLLKDKSLVCIWCYAATFLKNNSLHGCFCTDNCPSEVAECRWAGIDDKEYTTEYVHENLTYYGELIGEVIEEALSGDKQRAVEYVRQKYLEKYDDDLTRFNANTLQIS